LRTGNNNSRKPTAEKEENHHNADKCPHCAFHLRSVATSMSLASSEFDLSFFALAMAKQVK